MVARHAAGWGVDEGCDEDVAGEGNKVHGGTVEGAVSGGEIGIIRDGSKRCAKHVEGT